MKRKKDQQKIRKKFKKPKNERKTTGKSQ